MSPTNPDQQLKLDRLQKRLSYTFQSVDLLRQALTHRSAHQKHNYERLEFLGDALLGLIVAQALYERFPQENEGRLTRMRATLVRQESLCQVARELQLGQHLILSSGEMKSGGHQWDSILADGVEALIGAMYLDCGDLEQVRAVVLGWLHSRLQQVTLTEELKDPKTRLQEWLQGRHRALPQYRVVRIQGEAPSQKFFVECHVEGVPVSTGTGSSRRFAEQAAAQDILQTLEQQP